MPKMSDNDLSAATIALMSWFESQQIDPGNAALVMARVNATIMVKNSTDIDYLNEGLRAHHAVLRVEVAELVRSVRRG